MYACAVGVLRSNMYVHVCVCVKLFQLCDNTACICMYVGVCVCVCHFQLVYVFNYKYPHNVLCNIKRIYQFKTLYIHTFIHTESYIQACIYKATNIHRKSYIQTYIPKATYIQKATYLHKATYIHSQSQPKQYTYNSILIHI